MRATAQWTDGCGLAFGAEAERAGVAHLRHYSAAYREWGDGPPLVLVPGLAGGLELLSPLARELAKSFHVIAYQLRGEDDSFALRRRFDRSDLVADLAEFISWRGLERPTLCGVSFGGALAVEYASRHPQRLNALIVQGVGGRYERGLVQRIAGQVLSRYPLPEDCPFVNQFFSLLFGRRPAPELLQFVARQCWQTDQSVMAHRLKLIETFDVEQFRGPVRTPTLSLTGGRDLLVSQCSSAALQGRLTAGTAETLAGAGHLLFASHPAWMAGRVRQFVRV